MIYTRVSNFYRSFTGKKCVIGYSFSGREIYAFHIGDSFGAQMISTYAIHGREWICAELGIKHIKRGLKRGGGWIIPLANPDGAVISQTRDPLWKANARGVDLNCNFEADWGMGRLNTRERGGENCIGDFPFSEPETQALKAFTLRVRPYVTFSFHTKGEEIYYEFGGSGDERGAAVISDCTGYAVKKIYGSCGGYKDWCIQKLHIPAYTVECGSDALTHPITKVKSLKKCYNVLSYFSERYAK